MRVRAPVYGIYMCAAFKPPLSIFWAAVAPVLATGEAAASRRMRGKDEGFNCGGAERDNMTAVRKGRWITCCWI